MTVSFNPPSQPGGNQLNPVAIWVQNLIDSLKAAFAQVNLIRPVIPPVVFETGAVATGTTAMPSGDTIPTNAQGDQYMSLAYTPTNANSTLIIDVILVIAASASGSGNFLVASLCQDSTVNALASGFTSSIGNSFPSQVVFRHKMLAGTTSSTTFKVRAGCNIAGTTTFNGSAGARVLGGSIASSITIAETLP